MKAKTLILLTLGTFALAFARNVQAAMNPATVRAATVTGNVQKQNDATGEVSAVKANSVLAQGWTLVTGKKSSVFLLFSNGSTFLVEQNSSIKLATLLQEQFDAKTLGTYENLTGDPSKSQTRIDLNYGEISGEVKKLRADSNFEVWTPAGAAGIRGTIVRITFQRVGDNMIMTTTNADGTVEVKTSQVGAAWQDLPKGAIMQVDVSPDPNVPGQKVWKVSFANVDQATVSTLVNKVKAQVAGIGAPSSVIFLNTPPTTSDPSIYATPDEDDDVEQ